MILSFHDKETALIFSGIRSRKIPFEIQRRALRKLDLLDVAVRLEDLRVPPGNHLKALQGDRTGQHSIRINRG